MSETEPETPVEETEVDEVEDDGIDPIDITRGDDSYYDTAEGADRDEEPVPSVYGSEDVIDGREAGAGDS
ncbi:MAG: hypothetical protein ACOYB3_01775 [Azonexus sp.]